MYKVKSMTHTVRLSSTAVRYYSFQLKVHSLFTRTNWYFDWLVGHGRWLQVQGSTVLKRLTTAIITHIPVIKFLNKSFLKIRNRRDFENDLITKLNAKRFFNFEHLFKVLRKCNNKFDCLVYKMLYIKDIKPSLNTQVDSIRTKLFT